ncbi:carbohydrate ABC transporter permease [Breznakiella homolactica]|uniref:Sugar ABC transporter permease n=1 Tax=Breznakiella homolactica TaxID=2798577 RepID=A0A7T7XRD2_9SPIR|nr:sugar ABC transporter permease [Breznakiella homolactica]QQO11096.1 sugar ABC transporter permease [Breznakiella homolactica]
MASKNRIRIRPKGALGECITWLPYLLPALIFYIYFMAWPLLDSIRLSLYTGSVGLGRTFVGFQNFKNLFTVPQYYERYWGAFGHTCYFFLIHMLVQNCLGILFATLLTNKTMRGRSFYQTVIFLPVTLAVLVTGYLWKLLLNPVWSGPFLQKIGLDFLVRPWLGDRSTALTCVALVSCWQWIGIPTMMFVAALRNISDDLFEAADIEGANGWQVFWKIKLPLIKPVVGMIAILTFVNNFNAFDVVFSMTNVNGAPNYATDLIGTLFYRVGIAGQHPVGIPDSGMGAAIATITFFVLCLGVIPTLRATQGKE